MTQRNTLSSNLINQDQVAITVAHPGLGVEGISPGFSASPAEPSARPLAMQNVWRRRWNSLCEMEEWKLTALIYCSSLSVWGLCTLVLPCTPGLLAILGVSIFTTWWPNSNTKGTSARKSSRRSRRKNPRGASVPWEGVEGSAESLKAGWGKPHGGECWESSCRGEAASARELPQETGAVDQGGNVSADTSSELLRNQPSITNMEELARSLMESLDITQICLDLLGELKETQPSTAPVLCGDVKKEHLVCPQCRRCLVGSCPHYSEPMAERDLPVLAAFLHTVDILVHEEDLQLEVGLGFELAVGGEPGYVWEITQRLPEIAPERCCKDCKAPLPRSPGESEGSQPFFPVLRAQGAAAGEMGAARQDARAPPARQAGTEGRDSSSAGLPPAGQGESLPSLAPTQPLPPRAQPPSPTALDRLRRVGMKPLPWVGYKGLGQGLGLQRISQAWCKLKARVQSSVGAKWAWLWEAESSAPDGTTEEDQKLPFDLRFKVEALFRAMAMEA
ncbi:uncharacterized protein J5F26_003675 [Ciconia maguari]